MLAQGDAKKKIEPKLDIISGPIEEIFQIFFLLMNLCSVDCVYNEFGSIQANKESFITMSSRMRGLELHMLGLEF